MREMVTSIEREYRRYKGLAEGALEQLTEPELVHMPSEEGNSIAILVWHVSGNLKSRFTDFLTSDGEKPWRDRDSEFASRLITRADLRAKWDEGWTVLFAALAELSDETLSAQVSIRNEKLTVYESLNRSLAHTSYHVGQIVFLAKLLRGANWHCLSIPKNKSRA